MSTMHFIAEAWQLINTTFKNRCVKCGFLTDHVSSSGDSAVKLTENEEDDWCSLQTLGVQSEDYITYKSDQKVCDVQTVDQV
jgi:hypothetical protein